MKNGKKCVNAFTLMELLLSIILFVIIIGGIYQSIFISLKARKQAIKKRDYAYELFLFEDIIRNDIANCIALNNIYLVGDNDSMYFYSTKVDDNGYRNIVKIDYSEEKAGFLRLEKTYQESVNNKAGTRYLFKDFQDIKFQYAFRDKNKEKIKWQKKWKQTLFPEFIQMDFTKDGIKENTILYCPIGEIQESGE